MFGLITPSFYFIFFLIVLGCLSGIQVLKLYNSDNFYTLDNENSKDDSIKACVLSLFLVIFFGTRNPYSPLFADTSGYTMSYELMKTWSYDEILTKYFTVGVKDILWVLVTMFFAKSGFSVTVWYLFVAFIYIFGIYGSIKKLFPSHQFIALLFAFLNFGFYGGGVNGIRNWMALSIVLFAMAQLLTGHKKLINILIAIILMIIAYLIHGSTILPSLMILTCYFLIKNPSVCFKLWFVSIVVSLFVGNTVSEFFTTLGLDDRTSYLFTGKYTDGYGPAPRFRWDFILFSSVPIFWGYWLIKKKDLYDKRYNLIYNAYILSNSIWILVIRAPFSNRFASLSWFFYFLVLIYPLLKSEILPNQGKYLSIIMIGLFLINIVL